jgi:hypothetical protein
MNQDNDKRKATDIDPQVSDHYASLADEKTPADLDRAVLREATRAVRTDNRRGSFGAWFRPVAFMAMVGLSLAIILDLNDTSIFNPPADMPFETAPPAPVQAPANNAADAAARNRSQTTFSEFKRQEKSAAAQAPTADAPDATGDSTGSSASPAAVTQPPQPVRGKLLRMQSDAAPADTRPAAETLEDYAKASDVFTAEAESAEQRVRKLEAAVDANLPSQPGTAAQLPAPQSTIASENYLVVEPVGCSKEQKSDVEEWWKCIETFRQTGLADVADREFSNLRKNYADFVPPE